MERQSVNLTELLKLANSVNPELVSSELIESLRESSRYKNQELVIEVDGRGWNLLLKNGANNAAVLNLEIPKFTAEGLCISTHDCLTVL